MDVDDSMDVDEVALVESRDAEARRLATAKKELQRETLPWVEKYRPSKFDDLVAHEDIITTCASLNTPQNPTGAFGCRGLVFTEKILRFLAGSRGSKFYGFGDSPM
jgi:hypothetical protein